MKIRELRMDFERVPTAVSVWAICWTQDDCDDLIAWLQMAKSNMKQWDEKYG